MAPMGDKCNFVVYGNGRQLMVSSNVKCSSMCARRINSGPGNKYVMSNESHQISRGLESWYGRKNGQYLLTSIRQSLEPTLDVSFGYHILQMAVAPGYELYDRSPINHRVYCADQRAPNVSLVARADELPLESDSVDTIIAHHSLEFGPNPHNVLREMQRILAPQGHLLIVGFNPYSLFGAATRLRGLSRKSLWHQHNPVSKRRLTDWLHLLGCEVQSCSNIYGLPPVGSARVHALLARCDSWSNDHNLPTGGVYVLHAIKQVSAMNKPRLRLRERGERLIGLAVPKPKPGTVPSPAPAVSGSRRLTKSKGEVAA